MIFEQLTQIRLPAVAGQFYPGEAPQLSRMLDDLLQDFPLQPVPPIKALIAPHAGYIYSGPIAASVYSQLESQTADIHRVILLGPSHHVGFHGIAASTAKAFRTPLGDIPIDTDIVEDLLQLPQVMQLDQAHAREHSLEVQLPFLQRVLGEFKLVPLVVGDSPPDEVAEVLERVWGGEETLIVISSDLSHFHPYAMAKMRDEKTSRAILELAPERIDYGDACGRNPVNGLLVAARAHGLHPALVDLRNSGDTAGSQDRVVGYGAYRFTSDV